MKNEIIKLSTKNYNNDFRRFLQDELAQRCSKNPHYSLRAFARSLNIGPSFLSMMLRSQRTISKTTIKSLGLKLGLSPTDIESFSKKKDKIKKTSHITQHSSSQFKQITLDYFRLISDWYHYAILELVSISDFEQNYKNIALALGISVNEAQIAIERLIRLKMLKRTKDGWKNISGNNTNIDNEFVIAARRKLQKQILEKALLALEEVPIQNRDQSSITMAIDTSLLPEAKKRITQFRRELSDFLQSSPKKNEVYNLSLSLYPLTKLSTCKGASK